MDRHSCLICLALTLALACTDDDNTDASSTFVVDSETSASSGDGDPGDGDPTTGDGDGDPTTGDGDGDPGDGDGDEPPPPLELPPSDPPVSVPDGTLFSADVSCGPHPENVFDVFLPPSDTPTPLVVFIHGGGFTGGDKSSAYSGHAANIEAWLDAGIAFATINYRLLEDVDSEGVIKPLGDSAYCLQFMRYHAVSLNIVEDAVAAFGGSAGAGTSLWLATHDDMADPQAMDPVRRESTRLRAAGAIETQATYDVVRWEEVFAAYGLTIEAVVMAGLEQRLLSFYGIDDIMQLDDPEILAYRANVDMLALMDANDAPLWILSDNQPEAPPLDIGLLFHHPYHARTVMEQAIDVGLEQISYIPVLGINDPSGVQIAEYFIDKLQ